MTGWSTATHNTRSTEDDKNNMFDEILNSVCRNVFRHFIWRHHLNVSLPARRSVKVPVIFNQNLARSSVSECYTISFHNTDYTIPNQVKLVFYYYHNAYAFSNYKFAVTDRPDNSYFSFFIHLQKVCVTGHVKDRILVEPDVIDVGLCYLTSSVQVASIHLRNSNRVVVPFEVKLPREMSKHVQLSHSKGYLKAESSIEVFIHLSLKCIHMIRLLLS